MQQTKNEVAKVNGKFSQIGKNVESIISGLDETMKQMDAEIQPTSRIQMDFSFGLFQPRMKMFQAYWIVSD
jgi:hypothetical protein